MGNITTMTLGRSIPLREDGQNYSAPVSPHHLEKDTRLRSWVTLSISLVVETRMVRIWVIWQCFKLRVSLLPSSVQLFSGSNHRVLIFVTDQRWYVFQNMGVSPSGRSGHAMASIGSKVVVVGGESLAALKGDPNVIHVLDTSQYIISLSLYLLI